MNFGETLTYWYLRLNGFFPLANFVVHRGEQGNRPGGDVDFVAIRFPYAFEEIGGREEDWDLEVFQHWEMPIREAIAGLIVEVKTGHFDRNDLLTSFSEIRISYALSRMGFGPHQELGQVASELANAPLVRYGDPSIFIAKVLISVRQPAAKDLPPFFHLPLEHVSMFIENRMEKYIDRKRGERIYFPSDLLQYVIWRREVSGNPHAAS